MSSILHIVSVPIGNMQDITLRAIETLTSSEVIICEDTRNTGILLKKLDINRDNKRLVSFFSGSGNDALLRIRSLFQEYTYITLVTDAGTPGISDPGYKVLQIALEENVTLVPIPGPSAFLAGLVGSGLPMDKFIYLGFLPKKHGRKKIFEEITSSQRTVVFYESPYRIQKTCEELSCSLHSERKIVLARELTKKFETFYRGSIDDIIMQFKKGGIKIKGEFVVLIEPA